MILRIKKIILRGYETLLGLLFQPLFYAQNLTITRHSDCSLDLKDKKILDLVTIAFNSHILIEKQITLIKKYLKDPYFYTVIDNSSVVAESKKIEQVCKVNNVGYIRLPKNIYPKALANLSHGISLNWAYKNYVLKRGARYFGFIDHDVFPIKETTVLDKMAKYPMYGLVQKRDDIWYLWPGFCFYRSDFLRNKTVNFLSDIIDNIHIDTGGANWRTVYKFYDRAKLVKVHEKCMKILPGKDIQSSQVQYLDDWIHLINGSNWFNLPKNVFDQKIKKMIATF